MYLCVNKSLKTAGISAPTSHILTVPFIAALEQLREVRGFKHQGRKNIEWKAANDESVKRIPIIDLEELG
jgi:hypothetical protein